MSEETEITSMRMKVSTKERFNLLGSRYQTDEEVLVMLMDYYEKHHKK